MKIIRKKEALHADKKEGIKVDYYLRDEYEVHFNEQAPESTQAWHHHEKILETIFIIEGELTAKWKESGKIIAKVVKKGDLIETENTPHTFVNNTQKTARFLVIKQVPSGNNKRELLKTDKVLD